MPILGFQNWCVLLAKAADGGIIGDGSFDETADEEEEATTTAADDDEPLLSCFNSEAMMACFS